MPHFLEDWATQSDETKRLVLEEGLILEVTEGIWEALEKRDMSKADLAEAMGKSKALVSQLLNGSRNMTLRTLADIAYELNLRPEFHLLEKGEHFDWVQIGTIRATSGLEALSEEQITAGEQLEEWTRPVPTSSPVGFKSVA